MKVVFRVDASQYIGSGHVMRCLVLAQALRLDDYSVVFATRPQKGDLVSFIRQQGFTVLSLMQPAVWQVPKTTADYSAWLQVNQHVDAKEFIGLFDSIDLIIVDHYGIDAAWHKVVKNAYDCKIVVIDDLVRQHKADLIIDQTLLRNPCEYFALNPESIALTGTRYAILNADFATHHAAQKNTSYVLKDRPRLLLTMGGIDAPNATLQVLKVLKRNCSTRPDVTILLSHRAPHYLQVKAFADTESSWLTHVDFTNDMASLMCEHDIAIGAPGSTSWERACIGLPSIVVPLAENQQTICKQLNAVGASICVELSDISQSLMTAYESLLANYQSMRTVNLQLCDGLGGERIMKYINQLFRNSLTLRLATKNDIKQVYEWQCHPETRRYAINKSVPSLAEHTAWMKNKLESKCDFFYIIKLDIEKGKDSVEVGVVRLDEVSDKTYTISIYIIPKYFGKGIARLALQKIDVMHPLATIHADVLKENKASQRLFSRAGYQQISQENFMRYPMGLRVYE